MGLLEVPVLEMETGSEGEIDRNINYQLDGSKKRKRTRTPFQQGMLEKTYAGDKYPCQDTREKLSKTLGLTDRQVEMWFYRKRQKDNIKRTEKKVAGDGEVGERTEVLTPSKQEPIASERGPGGSGGAHHESLPRHLPCKDMNQTKEKPGVLKFDVGQLAETKTFETGFRSAWFKCKIRDVSLQKNKILPEYYDYPGEEITWIKVYAKPPYGKKSVKNKKQLMVRPQYPQMYHKNEMLHVSSSSISEVCIVIDGVWKVGDLVDWYEEDCYWSGTVIKILSDDKVQIELPEPPAGQGEVYEAFCKDLRPSLDWSPRKGWTLPNVKGRTCSAQLIFPSPQGMDSKRDEVASTQNPTSTSHISGISSAASMEESPQNQEVKTDADVEKASSSDSISTMHVEESKSDDSIQKDVDYNIIDLNIMHEETLEVEESILDLEELVKRIKWLQSILDNNQSRSGSWKFAQERPPTPSF